MTPRVQPPLRSAVQWRGLGVAALMALLAHALAWQVLTEGLALGLPGAPTDRTAASFQTRWLAPATAPADAKPRPSASTSAPTPVHTDSRAPTRPTEPTEAAKNDEIMPPALMKSAQIATDTIAIPASPVMELPSQVALASSLSEGAAMNKLLFPGSIQLAFDGTLMNRGIARKGSGMLVWKSDGDQYELSLEATAMLILSRREKSAGKLSAAGLAPERYSSVRTGRSEQATHFRYDSASIQFSNNRPQEVLLAGAQDRLSVLVQLAAMIGGDPHRFQASQRLQLQVAGLDNAQVWEIQLLGREELALEGGPVEAIKLVRGPRNEYDQKLEIWLLPQLGYLPARIRQSSIIAPEHDFLDLVLRTPLGPAEPKR